jgi:hypothetical protein
MKNILSLLLALVFLPLLSPASAAEKTFPKKNAVISFAMPEGWKMEVDKKDGSISINAPDGRISVNFAEMPIEATMEIFEQMLPEMVKALKDAAEAEKPKEKTEDGLTGYTATYAGKIEGQTAVCISVLFKGGKDRSILGNIIVRDPGTLPKESNEALEAFMKSLKGVAK